MNGADRPTIKMYGDLSPADFERHPIWVNCHDEAGEDDYRPHDGPPPRPPYDNLYVVRAEAWLADGTRLAALINLLPLIPSLGDPADADLFAADGTRVSLVPAAMGLGEDVQKRNLDSLGRTEAQMFPVRVKADDPTCPAITVLDWFTQRVEWP